MTLFALRMAATQATINAELMILAFALLAVSPIIISATDPNQLSPPLLAAEPTDQQQQQQNVFTFIVGNEDAPSPVTNEPSTANCGEQEKPEAPRFYLDATTKLIYIDAANESGYLVGEVGANERSRRHVQEELPDEVSRATNYSVFLISRNKRHIALLLEIEQLDFEPIINCENQELRLSIVGEISKQLLNSKKANNQTASGELLEDLEEQNEEETVIKTEEPAQAAASSADAPPPLPVSEAMAMLLNSPLNKTILDDSAEMNDFKIIDSTIDYLHDQTCMALHRQSAVGSQNKERPSARRARASSSKSRRKQRKSRRLNMSRVRTDTYCAHDSQQYKELMSSKLNDYFEWDDFKIVCGKTKQLLIPMRSLKLSVYSDEFSPSSEFVIRYQFIADPDLLPSQDSGKYYCRNRNVVDLSLKCNGFDDCGDASDESIKICGYPTSNTRSVLDTAHSVPNSGSQSSPVQGSSSSPSDISSSSHHSAKRRLTYVSGDVLRCCQSVDWMSLMPQTQNNQLNNLQSLIGDSMQLFSGPIFAPTRPKISSPNRRHKRIVGGGVAPKGAWPAQASLQYELLEPLCHFCAGTLIHPQYVLTAGHCITKDGLSRGIKVVFGAHDLRQLEGNHIQVRYVDDAQIYPGVDVKHLSFDWENDMNNDIALLRLNAPVQITPHVAPACLPPFNTPLSVNTTCRSIGWGQTHGSGSSNVLKHLSLKVVDSSLCSKELFDKDGDANNKTQPAGDASSNKPRPFSLKRGRFVSDFESSLEQYSDLTMVCVNNDLGHGICQGDSGGPLYCERQTASGEHCTEIYGVASFIIQYATVGAMCAIENLPGIFGEVSSKTEWISSTMKMFEQTYRLKYS